MKNKFYNSKFGYKVDKVWQKIDEKDRGEVKEHGDGKIDNSISTLNIKI